MENLKPKMSVMPTERDFSLLKSLFDNVVMSFPQISQGHFQTRSKPTVINRLTKLESAGLIVRIKVPRFEITGAERVVSVVYQISKSGIRLLQKRHPEMALRQEPVRLRPYSVDHDLLLVDVLAALKTKWPSIEFIHGELYGPEANHNALRPDAVLVNPRGGEKVALELELTAKSEKRYRELLLKYRLSREFARVIYVTGSLQIETKIRSVLGTGSERFEFLKLTDVLGVPAPPEKIKTLHPTDERKECGI